MLKKLKTLLLVGTLSIGVVGCSSSKETSKVNADTEKIALVLSVGGVNDQSFNQGAWEGAEKAAEELGVEVSYIESNSDADYAQNIETAVDNGNDLVVGVGFQMADAIKTAAEAYPEQKFAIIDSTYEEIPENVRCITFNEEQSGYLTGLIAAKMTKTNVIGWIGGMDIPSCSNFYVGFEKGAKEVNKDIKVLKQFTNSFTDAAKGRVVANQMANEKADIIFMAAGGGNAGALEVVRENNIKGIGVDMANNYLAPDHIVTSALKNVGEGLKLTIKDMLEDNFNGGNEVKYDISNGGVGYELTDLIPQDVIDFVETKINEIK